MNSGTGAFVSGLVLDQEIGGSYPPAAASATATSTPIGGLERELLQTRTGLMGQVLRWRTAPR